MDKFINNHLDFSISSDDIDNLKKHILKSNYYKNLLTNKSNKNIIMKTSLLVSLIFFILILFKVYTFVSFDSSTIINGSLCVVIFFELCFKIIALFICVFFILGHLNKKNSLYLICKEIENLNIFLGNNTFNLTQDSIEISNNRVELSLTYSDVHDISLYGEYILFLKNNKIIFMIKCNNKLIRNSLAVKLEQKLKKQILIKEI